ncbi:type II toxin-antitoxin system RelE/ParE family toxin [Candidatus Poribacteria bacterium]|nr:type II toxin-antitoxin system RelE/ParE family toxin [Candidatus Poribacteria bacterium]
MTRRVRVLPSADRDIDEHIAFIARERPDAALRFMDAVTTIFDHISGMSGMGSMRNYRNTRLRGLRIIPVSGFENFLVFYLVTTKTVDIVRVLHAARNFDNIFS